MVVNVNTIADKGRVVCQIRVVVFVCRVDKQHDVDWIAKIERAWIAILAAASLSWHSAGQTVGTGFVVFASVGHGHVVQTAEIDNTRRGAIVVQTIDKISGAIKLAIGISRTGVVAGNFGFNAKGDIAWQGAIIGNTI